MKNTKKFAVAIDFHDVIVTPDWKKLIAYTIVKLPKKNIITHFFWPPFLYQLIKERKASRMPETIFNNLCKKYPQLDSMRTDFIAMSNMQKIQNGMVSLLKKLRENKIPIILFSNIGPETLTQAKIMFNLDRFIDSYVTPEKYDNFSHKPNIHFFLKLKNHIKDLYTDVDTIIFIDDKKRNLAVANMLGIISIHYNGNINKFTKRLKEKMI